MEFKHFSHPHNLIFSPGRSEIHCSGCESPQPGPFYGCWKCNYFLDEQCFRASRSLDHPPHPAHPLTLVSCPTYQSASFFCNHCSLLGSGFCYCCSECDFDVHIHCAHVIAGGPSPHGPHMASVPVSTYSEPNDHVVHGHNGYHHHHDRRQVPNMVYPPSVNREHLLPSHVPSSSSWS